MLHCIYHFGGETLVVDDYDKSRLIARGDWFDHPNKAKAYKEELLRMNQNEDLEKEKQNEESSIKQQRIRKKRAKQAKVENG